jgi:hypothetical protein
MLRRLFFLFPDEASGQRAVDKLADLGIPRRRMHAIAPHVELKTLPPATERQIKDTAFRIEWILWSTNLAVFALALLTLVVTLLAGEYVWSLTALSLMLVTFLAGELFVVRVPDVHLTEFVDALAHGEILLMIDVPSSRVTEIENIVHHGYPVAAVGGVSWTVDAFGL